MTLAPSLPIAAIHKIAVLKIDLIPVFYKMNFKCTCPQSEVRIYHFIKAFKNVDVNESNTVFYSFEKCAVTLSWMITLKDLCRLKWKYWNARRINIRFFHWVAKGDTNWAWKRLNYGFFSTLPHTALLRVSLIWLMLPYPKNEHNAQWSKRKEAQICIFQCFYRKSSVQDGEAIL